MRNRTAQDDGMHHIFTLEIAHIDAATAQESQIFHALDGCADKRIDRPHAGASPDPSLRWTQRIAIIAWRLEFSGCGQRSPATRGLFQPQASAASRRKAG